MLADGRMPWERKGGSGNKSRECNGGEGEGERYVEVDVEGDGERKLNCLLRSEAHERGVPWRGLAWLGARCVAAVRSGIVARTESLAPG